jgi:hypothetical protein
LKKERGDLDQEAIRLIEKRISVDKIMDEIKDKKIRGQVIQGRLQ